MLAREVDGDLIYSGEVGTGFTNELLKSLYSKIQALEVNECPLDTPVKREKGFHWAEPNHKHDILPIFLLTSLLTTFDIF